MVIRNKVGNLKLCSEYDQFCLDLCIWNIEIIGDGIFVRSKDIFTIDNDGTYIFVKSIHKINS